MSFLDVLSFIFDTPDSKEVENFSRKIKASWWDKRPLKAVLYSAAFIALVAFVLALNFVW